MSWTRRSRRTHSTSATLACQHLARPRQLRGRHRLGDADIPRLAAMARLVGRCRRCRDGAGPLRVDDRVRVDPALLPVLGLAPDRGRTARDGPGCPGCKPDSGTRIAGSANLERTSATVIRSLRVAFEVRHFGAIRARGHAALWSMAKPVVSRARHFSLRGRYVTAATCRDRGTPGA